MTNPLLAVFGLTKRFGGLTAVDNVDFHVAEGQIVGLIGPNGAGKTTMFNLISRFHEPTTGKIQFGDRDLLAVAPHEIIRLGIARTFQNLGLFPFMSVRDNLLMGSHSQFHYGAAALALGVGPARREERRAAATAIEMLESFGMKGIGDVPASLLPYGTQKTVELLRALMSDPRLVLLDEPVAGMNTTETSLMGQFIRRIRDERHTTVLLVEHDMSLVMEICDWIVVLDFGRKIAEGTPEGIQNDPKVIEAYLGQLEQEVGRALV